MNHVRSLGRRLGLAGVAVVVALIPMTAVPLATAQAQPAVSADLAVTMRWIGGGTPRRGSGSLPASPSRSPTAGRTPRWPPCSASAHRTS
jgi:hypothetical protein